MTFKYLSIIGLVALPASCDSSVPDYRNASLSSEKRVHDLLSYMTLEEKAAQLDMLDAGSILESADSVSIAKKAGETKRVEMLLTPEHLSL
ncbi:MAG: hypothetical protein LBS52_00985 [Dysgonamonadaceae bacterium]|jgi:beta-glucosidase|nr:hypothetical protein [Dysgonamonadaceae bacterium]